MWLISNLRQGDWLNLARIRAYPRIFLLVFTLLGAGWIFGLHETLRPQEGAIVTDFLNVYAAGVAVHQGAPDQAYDWAAQKSREDQIALSLSPNQSARDGSSTPWLYPPIFFGVAWLAAFLPYFPALILYLVFGFAAYAVTMRRLAPRYPESLWALAAFPAVIVNLFSGQNGFLTTALVAAGLGLLETSPIAAGMSFGLLVYKPHFFVLIPLALFVARQWKAFAATILSAATCIALSLVAFGIESWLAFARGAAATRSLILEDTADRWLGILHSVFSMVRVLGGTLPTAYAIQSLVACCSVIAVLWIWGRRSVPLSVRGSVLVAALLLVSPYSFVYDQVLLAIPIALLAGRGLKTGFLPYEKNFLFALWLLPFMVQDSSKGFALPLTPPMLAALIALCLVRASTAQARPISAKPEGR